jgi:hypothetical protein
VNMPARKAVDVYVLWNTTLYKNPATRWQRVARFYGETFNVARSRAAEVFNRLWPWTKADGRMRIENVRR